VEPGQVGRFITAFDIAVTLKNEGTRRSLTWSPNFRIIDTPTVDPYPDQLALIERFEAQWSSELAVQLAYWRWPWTAARPASAATGRPSTI